MEHIKNQFYRAALAAAILSLAAFANTAKSQSNYKIEETNDVDVKLTGTSTLHKWEMNAKTVSGEGQFVVKDERLIALKSLFFSVEVEDLKSDSKGLDKNAYKALKSDEHKDIHYKLTSAIVTPAENGKNLLKTHGKLTIAGVTKEIDMDVYCVVNKDGTITCTGSDKLNMTDYKVEPPSFLMGAMKTGDAITLTFVVIYKQKEV